MDVSSPGVHRGGVSSLHHLDDDAFRQVNELARDTAWLHGAVLDYAKYGVVLFAVLLLAGLLVGRQRDARTVAAAGWAGAGMLLAIGLNQPLGQWVGEDRPYRAMPDVLLLAHRTADFSFPSDHAVMAGAVAGGLWLVSRRLGLVAAAAALLMAFARVYIGAHYPWDVLAGLAFGAAVVLLGWLLLGRALTRLVEWAAALPRVGGLVVAG